jgi:uroporphyrinogen-III synthase
VRILVTRPLPDGEAIARRLAAMGHQALLAPLLTVKFLEGPPLNLASVQAVLVTSANGVRALARRTSERGIAMYAVGPQTAEAAHQEGFLHVRNADGDALALAEAVSNSANPGAGTLLHAAGEDSGHALCEALAASGFTTSREILYRIEKASQLPAEAARALRKGEVDAALFFSPKSASLFAECAARDDLSTERLAAICISANTADSLKGMAFSEVRIAAAPNQDALLACL